MSEFKAVQLKRSTVTGAIPSSAQLVDGELSINLIDKKLYSKSSSGVFEIKGTVDDGTITNAKLNSAVAPSFLTTALYAVYPIGSQYVNFSNSTNPSILLGMTGTTWLPVAGKVIIGLDSSDALFSTIGNTGGSKDAILVSHSHSITDPGHTHTTNGTTYGGGPQGLVGQGNPYLAGETIGTSVTGITGTNPTGVSGTNANLQPYVVAYVWKRTA